MIVYCWAKQDIPDVLNFGTWFDLGQKTGRHISLHLSSICDIEDRRNIKFVWLLKTKLKCVKDNVLISLFCSFWGKFLESCVRWAMWFWWEALFFIVTWKDHMQQGIGMLRRYAKYSGWSSRYTSGQSGHSQVGRARIVPALLPYLYPLSPAGCTHFHMRNDSWFLRKHKRYCNWDKICFSLKNSFYFFPVTCILFFISLDLCDM